MTKNKRPTPVGADLKNQLNNSTKMLVLSMLTTEPQDRFTLASAIGISERAFRQAVHDLRNDGNLIISESNGRGYRLGTKKEAAVVARELRSRAYDLLKTARVMEGVDPDQVAFEEVLGS